MGFEDATSLFSKFSGSFFGHGFFGHSGMVTTPMMISRDVEGTKGEWAGGWLEGLQ